MQFECPNCGHRWYPRIRNRPNDRRKCPKCKHKEPFNEVEFFSSKSHPPDNNISHNEGPSCIIFVLGTILAIVLIIMKDC